MVSQILSGEIRETIVENIHSKLIEVGQKVRDGECPVELYQITKVSINNHHCSNRLVPHFGSFWFSPDGIVLLK